MSAPVGTTVNTNMVIYNDLAQTAYLERVQDVIEVFNDASGGAIQLVNEVIEGDLRKRSFNTVGGSLTHRDVNSTAKADLLKMAAGEMVGVKAPWKYGPYSSTEEQYKRRARNLEEFSELIGQDLADATFAYYIKAAFGSMQASIGANPNMVAQASFATDGKKVLTKGMRKFGDRSSRIAIFGMNSSAYYDLVDDAIDKKVYEEAGVVVYGGLPGTMGKPVLVSDQIPDGFIFGLQAGAAVITESQAPGFRSFEINDQENLGIGFRAEGTFNLDLMGYSWKETAGINPKMDALTTASNWVKHANSDKATAGVLIELT